MENKKFSKSNLNKTLIQPPEKGRWQTVWNTKQRVCLKLLDLLTGGYSGQQMLCHLPQSM